MNTNVAPATAAAVRLGISRPLHFLLVVLVVLGVLTTNQASAQRGGAGATTKTTDTDTDTDTTPTQTQQQQEENNDNDNNNNNNCGLWLGPSPIKEAEDHGWGHSMFTGKLIKKGTVVLGSGILDESKNEKVFGDLFIPVYDWEALDMGSYDYHDDEDDDDDDDDDAYHGNGDDDTYSNDKLREKKPPKKEAATETAVPVAVDPGGEEKEKPKIPEPPLFQQLWSGDIYGKQVLESYESMRTFIPGLSNIAPCTFENFNLEQQTPSAVTYRDWRNIKGDSHDETPPSQQAGSFSYLSNAMFVAARDILPGEELVVECADNSDEFDPKDYPPVKFKPKEAGGYSICLDDKVEERLADHTENIAGGSYGGQRGMFAKRSSVLKKGEVLTSTPMIPVHREELTMDRAKYAAMVESASAVKGNNNIIPPQKKQQLLLNYCYGHADSSLLWLPTAPLIHAVNHAPYDRAPKLLPNAKLQWHHDEYTEAQASGKPLTRRQQFHHAELLEMDSRQVVLKHGMGLMMDLVATRDIYEDEEILIDYGKAWDDAMKLHGKQWQTTIENIQLEHTQDKAELKRQRKRERELTELKEKTKATNGDDIGGTGAQTQTTTSSNKHKQRHAENSMTAIPLSSYVTASDFNDLHHQEEIRTVTEQHHNPYPSNLETACYFESDWLDDDINDAENAALVTFESWYSQENHFDGGCLLPCIITERRDYIPGEEDHIKKWETDDDYYGSSSTNTNGVHDKLKQLGNTDHGGSASTKRYTAKLIDTHDENTSIDYECHIYARFEYFFEDIPREGIVFVDKPHSTDAWIEQAFRQPIGLPEEMVPKVWKDLHHHNHHHNHNRRKGMRGSRQKEELEKTNNTNNNNNNNKNKDGTPMTEEEEEKERVYQESLNRWNDGETRREKLEELQEKGGVEVSARSDL